MEGMERVAIALVRAGADAKRENNAGQSSISLCSPYMASRLRAELDIIAKERFLQLTRNLPKARLSIVDT